MDSYIQMLAMVQGSITGEKKKNLNPMARMEMVQQCVFHL